ncbi:hypothetical protein AB0D38_48975 [Streptomyces sp. NPDC048279]|uniref:hypothetical protein n=1 Tax=Streptomyces sp. NPDC048279 TaxID=3154714 RepID=UPI0034123532
MDVTLRTGGVSVRWSLSWEALPLGPRRHDGIGDVAIWPMHRRHSLGLCIRLGPLRPAPSSRQSGT